MNPDKRREGETFEAYKQRVKEQNQMVKEHLKGEMFWPSFVSGTWKRNAK